MKQRFVFSLASRSFAVVSLASLMGGACQGQKSVSSATSTTVASSSAISEASTSAQALELSGLLALVRAADAPPLPMGRGPHGMACDTTPEITYTEICGKQFPAQARFEWSSCTPDARGRHGPDAAPRPSGASSPASLGSGDISITTTTAGPADCSDTTPFDVTEDANFVVTRNRRDGGSEDLSGTSHTVAQRLLSERRPLSRTSTFASTRLHKDSAGTTTASLKLEGTTTVGFDDATDPPTRTSEGSFTYDELKDGTTATGTLTLTGLRQASPRDCRWPVAGTVVRTGADGSSQTLVFSETCGEATLDGEAVTLVDDHPQGEGHGGEGHGGEGHGGEGHGREGRGGARPSEGGPGGGRGQPAPGLAP